MTNEQDREEAKSFADRIITNYITIKKANSGAFYDGIVIERCADIILHRDGIIRAEAVRAERDRLLQPIKNLIEDYVSDHRGYKAVSGPIEQEINAALDEVDAIFYEQGANRGYQEKESTYNRCNWKE